jgi:hypothetical protein
MISPDQPPLLTIEDVVGELDPDQQRDLRAYLARGVMHSLGIIYELTNQLVVDGEEPKSRKKRLELPEGWLEVRR